MIYKFFFILLMNYSLNDNIVTQEINRRAKRRARCGRVVGKHSKKNWLHFGWRVDFLFFFDNFFCYFDIYNVSAKALGSLGYR
jgi:hypothetical protein